MAQPVRRRVRAVHLVAAAVALALGAAGCGGATQRSSTPPTTRPAPAPSVTFDNNGQFTLGVSNEPTNWNVLSAGGAGQTATQVVDRVLPSVFRTWPDLSVHLDKAFVRSAAETATSPQTVVYQIDPKAVWADGTPITYRDFVYNWHAQSGASSYHDRGGLAFDPASTSGYRDIRSVRQTHRDPYTVTVVFRRPFGDWRSLFADLLPAHLAPQIGFDTGYTHPVSDLVSGGPFMVQDYQPGTSLTLVRNPRYWGPPAALASVTFRFLSSAAQVVPGLDNDDIQGAVTPLRLSAALRHRHGFIFDEAVGLDTVHLDFNQTNRWLQDPAVRQAIMLAVGRKALIAATVGRFDPGIEPLDSRFYVPGEHGYRDNSGGRYDTAHLADARSGLAAAGYDVDAAGNLTKGGQAVTLRLTAAAGSAVRQSVEQYLSAALRRIGITVVEVDSASLRTTLATANFDLALVASTGSVFPSRQDATYHSADQVTGAGSDNHDAFSDPRVDALLTEAAQLADGTTRSGLYNQIDRLLWADSYNMPLFQRPVVVTFAARYTAVQVNPTAEGLTWNLQDWALKAGT